MTHSVSRLAQVATLLGVFVTGAPRLAGQGSSTRADTAASLAVAIRTPAGQRWADALMHLSRSTRIAPASVATVTRALGDTASMVRLRGAQAAGALGPLARHAVPQLVGLLSDTVAGVAEEAAFALGVVGDRTEPVLKALFEAGVAHDGDRFGPALLAITGLGRYPLVRISPPLSEKVRLALRSSNAAVRGVGLRTAMRVRVPWALSEFTRLLGDPDPEIRVDAAYAVIGLGPEGRAAESSLTRLSRDSVSGVRDQVPDLLKQLGHPLPKATPVDACRHRARSPGPASSAFSVTAPAGSLRDDGRGPYRSDDAELIVSQGTAFNFLLPGSPREPGPAPDRASTMRDSAARFLEIDLTRPVPGSGAVSVMPVKDPAAQFHAFFLHDARGTLWNLRDIPVGASIRSDRTELSFFLEGRYHLLQFGPWTLGDCSEGYAYGARIHGEGTTSVTIHRVSDHEFIFSAAQGSIGRLWAWARGEAPKNRGLYFFSFELRVLPGAKS